MAASAPRKPAARKPATRKTTARKPKPKVQEQEEGRFAYIPSLGKSYEVRETVNGASISMLLGAASLAGKPGADQRLTLKVLDLYAKIFTEDAWFEMAADSMDKPLKISELISSLDEIISDDGEDEDE